MSALERVKRAAEPGASPYNCYPSDLAKLIAVAEAAKALVREHQNPVPDAAYRKTLRDHLEKTVTALET